MDLRRRKLELGHGRVTSHDPLRERFAQRLDRVAEMEASERRSRFERAISRSTNGVASCAVGLRESLSALLRRRRRV